MANPIRYVDPDGKNPVLTIIGTGMLIYGGYKTYKWCENASEDAEKARDANIAAQNAIDAALNGQPYHPSDIEAAKDATKKSIQSDMDVVNNLPPGTSATPFNKVKPR
jgi:hypothetical protein